MTVMKSRKYYTPVEFARLFRIDRQTLIYYDNHGIFSPSLKNENGYRYYSLDQVFRFAELLSLRNLSVPGSRLSDYNQQPTVPLLKEILHDKIMEYEDKVSELSHSIRDLKATVQIMDKEQYLPLDRIMLIPKGTLYCQRSRLLSSKISHREALLQSAPLVAMYAESTFSRHLQFSFLPVFSNLEELALPHDYHIVLLSEDPDAFSNPLTIPPSLYLTVILKDRFHRDRKKHIDRIRTFLDCLHLIAGTTFLIPPVRNQWQEEKEAPAFYTKLELQVEYGK